MTELTIHKIEFLVALINEFGQRFGLTDKQSYDYISRYGGIEMYMEHYNILHTLSFRDNVEVWHRSVNVREDNLHYDTLPRIKHSNRGDRPQSFKALQGEQGIYRMLNSALRLSSTKDKQGVKNSYGDEGGKAFYISLPKNHRPRRWQRQSAYSLVECRM